MSCWFLPYINANQLLSSVFFFLIKYSQQDSLAHILFLIKYTLLHILQMMKRQTHTICLGFSFNSVQSLSCVQLFATPWTAADQASLSITNSQSLPKLMSIGSVIPSPSHPLSSPSPPAFNLSQQQGLFK